MIDDCNIKNLAKNQVSAVFNSRTIRRSVSPKFIEICMETPCSLVILKLDFELIATEIPFAPNNYLSDPNQHIKSLPKSTRRKIVNLPEHFQLICIISKGLEC